MKIIAHLSIAIILTCMSVFSAEPYTYRLMEKQDISYGATKRMVHRIYLNTQIVPSNSRMKATAQQVWQNETRKWDEFTVFMIFGQIKDFNAGAYGIAEFTPSGMADFSVNEVPLQMLELEAKTQTPSTTQTNQIIPAVESKRLDPQKLCAGQSFIVSKQTPLMPEIEPADPLKAIQQMKKIPKDGAFKIFNVRKKGSSSWYQVVAIGPDKKKIGDGWINSIALIGQDLKPYK